MEAIRVLLVDDNPTFLRSVRKTLRAMPRVTVIGAANSGAEGLSLAQSGRPDLVLLDICLFGMDGIETARRLRAQDNACKIVLMSQMEHPETVVAQSNVVVDGVVGKPNFVPEMASLLQRLFPCAATDDEAAADTILMRLLADAGPSAHVAPMLPYWVWSMDADLRFDEVRGAHETMANLTRPEYLYHRLWDLPLTEPLDGDWAPLRSCMTTRTAFADMMLRRTRCSGQVQYFSVSGTPLFDGAGLFVGYLGLLREATLEQRGPTAASRMAPTPPGVSLASATRNTFPLALCMLSGVGTVLAVNEPSRYLRAGNPLLPRLSVNDDYLDIVASACVGNAVFTAFVDGVKNVLKGEINDFSLEYESGNTSCSRWFLGRAVRLASQDPHQVLVSHEDITERRKARTRREEIEVTVEQMVAARTAQLRRRTDEQQLFNRSVAHDLRNQMNAIQGFAHLLLDGQAAEISTEARDSVTWIARAADQLSLMLDGLLALGRVARGALVRENVDLTSVAREITQGLARRYEDRTVAVTIAALPPVTGDPQLLKIALQNLLENAWKYTAQTPNTVVEVGGVRSADGTVTCWVRDNGPGFPADMAARLFLPFKRMHAAAGIAGAGLGLSTVKGIMDCHDGQVWAESAPGKGATFFFSVPGQMTLQPSLGRGEQAS